MASTGSPQVLEYLVSSMTRLLDSGKYSDLTIRCKDRVFKVHCALVCTRSDVLATAVDGKFKEAIDREIDLEDDDPSIVGHLIDFLYHGDYDDGWAEDGESVSSSGSLSECEEAKDDLDALLSPSAQEKGDQSRTMSSAVSTTSYESDDPLLINAKVYVAAEKYNIPPLKTLAAVKYKAAVASLWNNPTFSESAELLYSNTVESDRELRGIIAQKARENISDLLDRGEFVELLKNNGYISFDVLRLVVGKDEDGEEVDI